MKKLKKFFAQIKPLEAALVLFPIGVIAAAIGYVGYLYFALTPALSKTNFTNVLPITTTILDRDGQLLYEVGGPIQRSVVEAEEVPVLIKEATIVAEDKNFYKHIGIDPFGILRAMVANLKAGGVVQGGSTITQQLVKNTFQDDEQTLGRKVREAITAVTLESRLSKEQILTAYLNNVPYVGNIVGIEKASEEIFHKELADLTPAEAATLAALPRAPTALSPYNGGRDALLIRRNIILDELKEKKVITEEEWKQAKDMEIKVYPIKHPIRAAHFTMEVKNQLVAKYGREKVERGGLTVTTTLDWDLQKDVEQTVTNHRSRINNRGASNAGAVVVNPTNGDVLAMVGSFDYNDETIDGNVNTTVSARQPGSSFKPIVYATLLEKSGYSPGTVIVDSKSNFSGYVPRNYNGRFSGPQTVRRALARSLNVPAVKALSMAGLSDAVTQAKELGLSTIGETNNYGLSFALGAAEVKPLELTAAFGAFANEGMFNSANMIISVKDHKGEILYEYEPSPTRTLSAEVAFQISDILSDNSARAATFGANSPLAFSGRTVAAKTGTTNGPKDAWTVGYTRLRAVGVWTGNNDGRLIGGPGVSIAGPLWRDILLRSMEGLEYKPFFKPGSLRLVGGEYYAPWQSTPRHFVSNPPPAQEPPSAPPQNDQRQVADAPQDSEPVIPPTEPPVDVGGTNEGTIPEEEQEEEVNTNNQENSGTEQQDTQTAPPPTNSSNTQTTEASSTPPT